MIIFLRDKERGINCGKVVREIPLQRSKLADGQVPKVIRDANGSGNGPSFLFQGPS